MTPTKKAYLYLFGFFIIALAAILITAPREKTTLNDTQKTSIQNATTSPITTVAATSTATTTLAIATATTSSRTYTNPFIAPPRQANTSNIVGYYGQDLVTYVPDWQLNWTWENKTVNGVPTFTFTPRDPAPNRDYSDIVMKISTSTEAYNADVLLTKERELFELNTDTSISYVFETFPNTQESVRIQHTQKRQNSMVYDKFYFNSNYTTVEIYFSASVAHYKKEYAAGIMEFVTGLGSERKLYLDPPQATQ